MEKPLKSVMHGQCDARPTVTFPATGHQRPLTSTKLYCLVTDTCVNNLPGIHPQDKIMETVALFSGNDTKIINEVLQYVKKVQLILNQNTYYCFLFLFPSVL